MSHATDHPSCAWSVVGANRAPSLLKELVLTKPVQSIFPIATCPGVEGSATTRWSSRMLSPATTGYQVLPPLLVRHAPHRPEKIQVLPVESDGDTEMPLLTKPLVRPGQQKAPAVFSAHHLACVEPGPAMSSTMSDGLPGSVFQVAAVLKSSVFVPYQMKRRAPVGDETVPTEVSQRCSTPDDFRAVTEYHAGGVPGRGMCCHWDEADTVAGDASRKSPTRWPPTDH